MLQSTFKRMEKLNQLVKTDDVDQMDKTLGGYSKSRALEVVNCPDKNGSTP